MTFAKPGQAFHVASSLPFTDAKPAGVQERLLQQRLSRARTCDHCCLLCRQRARERIENSLTGAQAARVGEMAGDETAPAGSQATARSLHLNSLTYPSTLPNTAHTSSHPCIASRRCLSSLCFLMIKLICPAWRPGTRLAGLVIRYFGWATVSNMIDCIIFYDSLINDYQCWE